MDNHCLRVGARIGCIARGIDYDTPYFSRMRAYVDQKNEDEAADVDAWEDEDCQDGEIVFVLWFELELSNLEVNEHNIV